MNLVHKKKIILICNDPAGGEILNLILNNNENFFLFEPFFNGPSLKIFNNKKFKNNFLSKNIKLDILEKKILSKNPDLIITGAGTYNLYEHYGRIIAKKNNIESIAIVDYWCEYSSRFQRYINKKVQLSYPNWVFIMDSKSKKDFVKETNFNKNKIFISGSLNLEKIYSNLTLRKKLAKKNYNNKFIITFFSDAFYTGKNKTYHKGEGTCFDSKGSSIFGYTPNLILEKLINNLNLVNQIYKKNILFIFKPHPRENIDTILPIIKKNKFLNNIEYKIEKNKKSETLIFESDVIFGMGSVALFESGMANKPTFSIQIGLDRKKIYDPCAANFFNYSIKIDNEKKLKKIIKLCLIDINNKFLKTEKKYINYKESLLKTSNKIKQIVNQL